MNNMPKSLRSFFLIVAALFLVIALSSCQSSQQAAVLHAATIPGTDERCIMDFATNEKGRLMWRR
jgi:uncharacterized lipoprotein YehR (DUF1307 family)